MEFIHEMAAGFDRKRKNKVDKEMIEKYQFKEGVSLWRRIKL